MNNNPAVYQHIRTLGSMHAGSVDFVSNVLPNSIENYKTNTTASSSSSGYESVLSKSHKSLFSRLKRLMNFPSTKKSAEYQISSLNHTYDENNTNSPILSSTSIHDTRRKSFRRTISPTIQHIPFLYGLKNCGNTW